MRPLETGIGGIGPRRTDIGTTSRRPRAASVRLPMELVCPVTCITAFRVS